MRKFVIPFLLIFLLNLSSFAQTDKEKAAEQAAISWLALVDSGNYAQSWQEAASLFKAQVSKDQWEKMVASARGPLGSLVSRKLASARYTTQLPGVPDGEYVVIQFDSSFEHKKSAIETVTPMLDKDGQWRVSGYFIK